MLLQPLKALSLASRSRISWLQSAQAELVELVKGLDSIELAVQLQPWLGATVSFPRAFVRTEALSHSQLSGG